MPPSEGRIADCGVYRSRFTRLVTPAGEMGAELSWARTINRQWFKFRRAPNVGLFATRQKYVRQMPGRLCGETVDANGKRGFVLTLSTREQHIRRDKATSNICTNSASAASLSPNHMTLLGEAV